MHDLDSAAGEIRPPGSQYSLFNVIRLFSDGKERTQVPLNSIMLHVN